MNKNFWEDPAFWTACVSIALIVAAYLLPELADVLEKLSAPLTALILAIFGRSAAVQFAAFQNNFIRNQTNWVARLTPVASLTVDTLLTILSGVDVWERHSDALIVAASDVQLGEIERRQLAQVEKLCTVAEFLTRSFNSEES